MSSPVTRIEIAAQDSIRSVSLTDAMNVVSGPLGVEVTSTFSKAIKDQLDDLTTIYGEPSSNLSQMLGEINAAVDACKEAIDSEDRADRFRADDCMLVVQASLRDLFMYRKIGDGFAVVIGALTFAFLNKSGLPFSKSEMYAILRTLNAIRTAPFCSLESAVSMTEVLEDAGLLVDPMPLTDLLTDAQEAGFVDL